MSALTVDLPAPLGRDHHPTALTRAAGKAPKALGIRLAKVVVSLLVTAALLVAGLPKVAGAPWSAVAAALGQVAPAALAALGAVWLASLLAHTLVYTAALPGLTTRRALLMSLTGSSVSNLLPFGGAVGTALNYSMTRRWGHSRAAFVLFAVMSHVWGLAGKLCLPAVALLVLLSTGGATGGLVLPAGIAVAALGAAGTVLALTLAREDAAAALGRMSGHLLTAARRVLRRPGAVHLEAAAIGLRREGITLLRGTWKRSAAGMITYLTLQGILLWSCLAVVGAAVSPGPVLAAYALARLLSVIVVTPGGLGVVEVGMTAMLGAFGGDPVLAAAGVLLFRAFTFALEIPVGGALLLAWLGWGRTRRNAQERCLPVLGAPQWV